MRPIYALSLSLAYLPLWASSAHADLVFETEPNDTYATANKTVGWQQISFEGNLTLGDIDTFSVLTTPNTQGFFSYDYTAEWSRTNSGSGYLNIRETGVSNSNHTIYVSSSRQSGGYGEGIVGAGMRYFQLWSTIGYPGPSATVTGSAVEGRYRLTFAANNRSTIQGSSVPEPSAVLLGLALAGSGFCLRRHKKGKR